MHTELEPREDNALRNPRAKLARGQRSTFGRVESLARQHTEAAINTLVSIMNEPNCPPNSRIRAAEVLLNRGWGMPKATHVVEGGDGQTLMKIVQEIVHVNQTQETLEAETDDLVVDYHELRAVNGNGNDRS